MAWDIATFRATFPAFADPTLYPDAMLDAWHVMAECQLKTSPCGEDKCYDMAVMLLVAHIGTILTNAARGQLTTGVITSATIDKVSTSFATPNYGTSPWRQWLGLTPYGQQLLALLSACSVGGFYAIGRPETQAFRKAYGSFY